MRSVENEYATMNVSLIRTSFKLNYYLPVFVSCFHAWTCRVQNIRIHFFTFCNFIIESRFDTIKLIQSNKILSITKFYFRWVCSPALQWGPLLSVIFSWKQVYSSSFCINVSLLYPQFSLNYFLRLLRFRLCN